MGQFGAIYGVHEYIKPNIVVESVMISPKLDIEYTMYSYTTKTRIVIRECDLIELISIYNSEETDLGNID